MRIVEATVSKSVKKSDGAYGSSDAFASMKATLETGDDPDAVVRELQERVARAIEAEVGKTPAAAKATPQAEYRAAVAAATEPSDDWLPKIGTVAIRVTGHGTAAHAGDLTKRGLKLVGPHTFEGTIKVGFVPGIRKLPDVIVLPLGERGG